MASAVVERPYSPDVSDLDALFRGFADPTRIRIDCVGSCFTGITSLDTERRSAVARIERRAKDPCR